MASGIKVKQLKQDSRILAAYHSDSRVRVTALVSTDAAVHQVHIAPNPDSTAPIWILRLAQGITASRDPNDPQLYFLSSGAVGIDVVAQPDPPHKTVFLVSPRPSDMSEDQVATGVGANETAEIPKAHGGK